MVLQLGTITPIYYQVQSHWQRNLQRSILPTTWPINNLATSFASSSAVFDLVECCVNLDALGVDLSREELRPIDKLRASSCNFNWAISSVICASACWCAKRSASSCSFNSRIFSPLFSCFSSCFSLLSFWASSSSFLLSLSSFNFLSSCIRRSFSRTCLAAHLSSGLTISGGHCSTNHDDHRFLFSSATNRGKTNFSFLPRKC